jgi:hypothetical protein
VRLRSLVDNWTPGAPWFDDTAWNARVLPFFDRVGEAVGDSALAGVVLDGENYSGVRQGWWWTTDPTSATEAQVRAKAKERATAIGNQLIGAGGAMTIAEYFMFLPGSYSELVQYTSGNTSDPNSFEPSIASEWVDGLSSVSGVTFQYWDWEFYKAAQAGQGWDHAYNYNIAGWEAHSWAQRPNVYLQPFLWITMGPKARTDINEGINPPNAFDRQWTDAEVITQLQKARQYTQGTEIAIYEQNSPHPPNLVRPTGPWPPTNAQQIGGYARYGGVAAAMRSASA